MTELPQSPIPQPPMESPEEGVALPQRATAVETVEESPLRGGHLWCGPLLFRVLLAVTLGARHSYPLFHHWQSEVRQDYHSGSREDTVEARFHDKMNENRHQSSW